MHFALVKIIIEIICLSHGRERQPGLPIKCSKKAIVVKFLLAEVRKKQKMFSHTLLGGVMIIRC